jgi:DNA polymerase-3 subunit gamma/tau
MHPAQRQRLVQAVQHLGYDAQLVWEVGRVNDNPHKRIQAALAQKQLAAEQLVHSHPLVQRWIRDFAATIVPGSLKPLS